MKTAISIPNSVYEAAERLADRLGMSRSELYAKAVEEFVRLHESEDLTARIDRVCDKADTSIDPVLRTLEESSLPPDSWK